MKKYWMILIVLGGLFANSSFALDLSDLCGDFKFLDSDVKIYRGSFESGDTVLDHALVLVEVSDSNRAFVLYVNGAQPDWGIKHPGCSPHFGKMKGRNLTLKFQGYITVKYKFDKSDGAKIKHIVQNQDGSRYTTHGFVKLAEK